MEGKKLAKFLLLLMVFDLLLFSATEANPWWRRRRRRSKPRCDSSRPGGVSWVNSWQHYFLFSCPGGQFLNHWRSQHRNCKEDRIHYFGCSRRPVRYGHGDCAWSGHYENDYDQPLTFKCAHDGFITGIRSVYNSHHRDRRFAFYCCHTHHYSHENCKYTPYLNGWDQEVNYRVPHGYYMVGLHSYHHNRHEDRRWKFEICQLIPRKNSGK